MEEFFNDLFEYNSVTNAKLFAAIKENDCYNEYIEKLSSHILAAHDIWNNRILNNPPNYTVWPQIKNDKLVSINHDLHNETTNILLNQNLDETVIYTNSKGDNFQNNVRDILFHVINHSNYHRAQIAKEMKHIGIKPISTDYIFYKR